MKKIGLFTILVLLGLGFFVWNKWEKTKAFYKPVEIFMRISDYEVYCENQPTSMESLVGKDAPAICKEHLADSVIPFTENELYDYWGNPWKLTITEDLPDSEYELFSAGPDKKAETADDIIIVLPGDVETDGGMAHFKKQLGM